MTAAFLPILALLLAGQSAGDDPLPRAGVTVSCMYGRYSNQTRSPALTVFGDMAFPERYIATLGYQSLWLSNASSVWRSFHQDLISARLSTGLTERMNASVYYSWLHEGEIPGFVPAFIFHFMGADANARVADLVNIGASYTVSVSAGRRTSSALRVYGNVATDGRVLLSINALGSKASQSLLDAAAPSQAWTPQLFFLEGDVSVPLGERYSADLSAGIGRRVFAYDEAPLIAYNQREIMTGRSILSGNIGLSETVTLLPSLEYDVFEGYTILYSTIGCTFRF